MTRTYHPKMLDGALNPKYVQRARRPSGPPRASLFSRGQFVAWDGEGVTDGRTKRHRYVMLMNSIQQHTTINPQGIPTRDALETLCAVGEANRRAIHVVFGGSYDVNMILSDCSFEQVQAIWSGQWTPICHGKYIVNYRPRKCFSVRRRIGSAGHSSIVLWDVFGFFQSTFVDAVMKYIGSSKELDTIRERKLQRSTFNIRNIKQIVSYCAMECQMLVSVMEKLRDYLAEANLPISRWDGAGACAASLLKRESIIKHKRANADTPDDVLHAAQHAYAGGRTEAVRFGHAPNTPIFHYDINSAYPAAMRDCPSLAQGDWIHHHSPLATANGFTLVHAIFDFESAPMYPLFWRSHDTSIYYPQCGEGWYWMPEIDAARAAMRAGILRGHITILETWTWRPTAYERPFHFIDPLFEQRARWKRDGSGAEKALKLAINSLYGKTAQHIGGSAHEPPRYHQLEWAGYITSCTRALIYRACTLAKKKGKGAPRIIMVATDGVYSLDELDLDEGDNLGQWEATHHNGITVAQSGVYWTDDTKQFSSAKDARAYALNQREKNIAVTMRSHAVTSSKMFCRGFDKGSLDRDKIVSAWRDQRDVYDASLTRFVTMGSGLVSRHAFATRWRQWRKCARALRLSPQGTKRYPLISMARDSTPAHGLVMTGAAIPASQIAGQIMSAKYPLPWDDDGVADVVLDGASVRRVEQEAYDALV